MPRNFTFDQHLGFVGHIKGHDISRVRALENVKDSVDARNKRVRDEHKADIKIGQKRIRYSVFEASENSTEWQHRMGSTLFNLAPRGFGRATFRLGEVVRPS